MKTPVLRQRRRPRAFPGVLDAKPRPFTACRFELIRVQAYGSARQRFDLRWGGYRIRHIIDGTVAMSHETEVCTTKAHREVTETAALLLFMASGISAVLFFCTYAGGGVPWIGLLGVVAVAGLMGSVICLHRLGRPATPETSPGWLPQQ